MKLIAATHDRHLSRKINRAYRLVGLLAACDFILQSTMELNGVTDG